VYAGRIVTYEEVAALASGLNRSAALELLGFMNLLLSSATLEAKLSNRIAPLRDVQSWLFREVVSRDLLAALQSKFRNASLLDRPILHRSQLLFATRLVATFGQEDGDYPGAGSGEPGVSTRPCPRDRPPLLVHDLPLERGRVDALLHQL